MKTNKTQEIYEIKRLKNDYNGNPRYEIPEVMVLEFPKLKELGRKKRNQNGRIVVSYNIKDEICELAGKKLNIITRI